MIAFLANDARDRRHAIEALASEQLADPAIAFALRRLLAADPDVAVRSAAATATGRTALPDASGWLRAALRDPSPVVRDAAIRGLAHRRELAAVPALRDLARTDATWWVRRSAIYALGAIGVSRTLVETGALGALGALGAAAGTDAIAPAREALADPFWRVRHAAVQVLAVCGDRAPERRAEILADVGGGTADYLRVLWGPALVEPAEGAAPLSQLPELLRDRDPAVVTARLAELPDPPALALVELLCDPHVPLRELAAARIIEANDAAAFARALDWLDEPRIPHVAATVVALLDGLGDPARQLAERVLSAPARPGAIAWAIGWVVATRDVELAARAWGCAVMHDLRELAISLAPTAALRELLVDPQLAEHPLAVAAAHELVLRPAAIRREVAAAVPTATVPAVRAALIAAADDPDSAHVRAGLTDPDPLPRALALSTLAAAKLLSPAQLARALADRDPAVREAVLGSAPPAAVVAKLETERDPWVRRTAARALTRRTTVAHPGIALALTGDPDPWIRAHGAGLLEPADPAQRARLIELTGDRSPAVQAAIVEQLASLSDAELRAALPTASSKGGRGVHAWLDATDLETVLAAGARAALRLPPAALPDEVSVRVTTAESTAPPPPRLRRTFGRSGVEVTPLAVSGAFDLSPGSLHVATEAGVELMFWEPTYAAMTRFLRVRPRRDRTCVVTGSYHADAASIRADVERALRRLRRDTLDVFLLFWARSAARLDEAAFDALDQLKRAGKVRAIGFSTHDRGLAIDALARSPWDVVMTRHSAAHPGIETELLARAQAAGAGVLTFSALCYGRMVSGPGAPEPADCYRYSLSQPGITACITAPRRHRELVENVAVLERTQLDDTELARLRAHGAGVRIENQRFNTLIRQPTRDAAAAAMAMLEAELAPDDVDGAVSARIPRRPIAGGGKASPSALRRGRL